jgi:RNA polymerase sigma factor (sigma-70 family)
MTNAQKVIALLKAENQNALETLYQENRGSFVLFAKRFLTDEDEILDVYQDAIIALCENARKGKLDDLQSTVGTYLFGIGKFMMYSKLKKKGKQILTTDFTEVVMEYEYYEEDEKNLQLTLLRKQFSQLGEQCKKVLTLFYYEEKKLDEIQEILGYTNKDVLKSQKSRCLKQLRDLVNK